MKNLSVNTFLFPFLVLLAFYSQSVLVTFSNNGEDFFLYKLITPVAIGHFGFLELFFDFLTGLSIIPSSATKHGNRINKLIVYYSIGVLRIIILIVNGDFGPVGYIGLLNCLGVFIQLFLVMTIMLMLDHISEFYGVQYSGIAIYNAMVVSTDLAWFLLSPVTIGDYNGRTFHGIFVALIHISLSRGPMYAIRNLFFRKGAPDLATLFVIVVTVYVVILLLHINIVYRCDDFNNCNRKDTHTHAYSLVSTGSVPFRLFQAIHLSENTVPFLRSRLFASSSTSTCLMSRMVPSNLDDVCYVNALSSQSPMPRPIAYSKSHSLSFAIVKIVGCAILHWKWVFSVNNSPRYLHDTNTPEANVITVQTKVELRRLLVCSCLLNGAIVGGISVIGDIINFPTVSLIGFVNFVIQYLSFVERQSQRKLTCNILPT